MQLRARGYATATDACKKVSLIDRKLLYVRPLTKRLSLISILMSRNFNIGRFKNPICQKKIFSRIWQSSHALSYVVAPCFNRPYKNYCFIITTTPRHTTIIVGLLNESHPRGFTIDDPTSALNFFRLGLVGLG